MGYTAIEIHIAKDRGEAQAVQADVCSECSLFPCVCKTFTYLQTSRSVLSNKELLQSPTPLASNGRWCTSELDLQETAEEVRIVP
jgi:hypothetical protein